MSIHKRGKGSKPRLSLVKNLQSFKEVFDKAKEPPQIDLKKINRIRKAIEEGRYQIDFEKLADKLLEDQ